MGKNMEDMLAKLGYRRKTVALTGPKMILMACLVEIIIFWTMKQEHGLITQSLQHLLQYQKLKLSSLL